MVNICLFCETWGSGGIESLLLNIIGRIRSDSLRFTLAAAKIESEFSLSRLREYGVTVIELSGSTGNLPENHRRFRQLLKEQSFDVIHLNLFHALSVFYAVEAKMAGVPRRIIHSHNNRLRKSLTKPLKMLLHDSCRGICRRAATDLWACSAPAAVFMFSKRTAQSGSVFFVPNGIELPRFRMDETVRERMRHAYCLENSFVIGHVGRLCYQKNQSFLLDVFFEINKLHPETCLLLAGEGEDEQALRLKAKKLEIADRVLFLGAREDVEAVYWMMDLFLFPSVFEGFGIAVLEAQAAGLPVICSDRVPEEACVMKDLLRLPLDSGSRTWAEKAVSMRGCGRYDGAEMLRERGFSISDIARSIGEIYSGRGTSELYFSRIGER